MDTAGYDIREHTHRFAIWAAGRAASVYNQRFSVEDAKNWIEGLKSLTTLACRPARLRDIGNFDCAHKHWREKICVAAISAGKPGLSHGQAAKLINVYLKVCLVQAGHADHPEVEKVHPPIDRLLLQNLPNAPVDWKKRKKSWSTFSCTEYQSTIDEIRKMLQPGEALWRIERYWPIHS